MAGRWWTVRSTNSTTNFLSSHIVRTGLNLWITIHIFWVILKWSKGSLKVVMPQAYTSMTRERPDWKWVCCRLWKKYASKESWRMSGPFFSTLFMADSLKLMSLNVRGLKNKRKREYFYWLRKQNCDVIFLQETHCHNMKDEYCWSKEWDGQSIWGWGTNNSKGVIHIIQS